MNVQKKYAHADDLSHLNSHPFDLQQRPRYEREEVPSDRMGIDKGQGSAREETPEEGEI